MSYSGEGNLAFGQVEGSTLAVPVAVNADGELIVNIEATSVAVTGPLTDVQLRATPVPVSGTFFQATQPVSGTVTITPSGTQTISGTVTANAGTNLNTSALALDATLSRAQGSATSGQTGPLVQGSVTTLAPTYVATQTSPLTLTTLGALRVNGSKSGTVTQTANTVALNIIRTDNDTNGPVWTLPSMWGGSFAGTANAAKQGSTLARTSTVFNTVQATASGNTAIWTSGTGNRWRLLAFQIIVTANASIAVGGVVTVRFQDVAANLGIAHDIFIPTVAITTSIASGYDSGWIQIGTFGILAAATATVLNVNLSSALATGNVRVNVAGTEE